MGGHVAVARQRFDPVPECAGAARRLVRELLLRADSDDLVDAAELVVSELVTNALLHTATVIEVSADVDETGLLIEVADGSSTMPAERDFASLSGTGRGLGLVHELTATWGVRPVPDGKVVWARVTADPVPPAPARAPDPPGPEADREVDGSVAVELRNLPLLMHLAWHEHAETLLRDYLLSRLEDDEAAALAEHAVVSAALALLHEQVPAPVLPGGVDTLDDVAGLLTSVAEPAATLAEGLLRLPSGAAASFAIMDQVLDAAVAMAETDRLLAAPMQPELRALRRWLCGQVESQTAGAAPVPWSSPASLPAPGSGVDTADWDHAPIDRAVRAVVAVDDTDRVIAVSDAALALLGYAGPDDLVGRRLLALIPVRFHQGHLAGFTRYLTHGRDPLIGTPVVVPFVRADGTEIILEMLVEVLSVADGRRVFVATLRDPS
ncbi:PAS domain S-box protein [Nocardioides sp. LMS-CY]|uniref:PAS domain S-box protein n=1 Tax=Nocardioides sp. (strain LMS-CY) TaxID=2840457 RepID=UPI001C000E25|nr:PAS domain S-box protein [Nocardioides sp. LMS-CY]QWF21351.1 PAS domain S-box protein [Nocardioides sp. LMS-CY]